MHFLFLKRPSGKNPYPRKLHIALYNNGREYKCGFFFLFYINRITGRTPYDSHKVFLCENEKMVFVTYVIIFIIRNNSYKTSGGGLNTRAYTRATVRRTLSAREGRK